MHILLRGIPVKASCANHTPIGAGLDRAGPGLSASVDVMLHNTSALTLPCNKEQCQCTYNSVGGRLQEASCRLLCRGPQEHCSLIWTCWDIQPAAIWCLDLLTSGMTECVWLLTCTHSLR